MRSGHALARAAPAYFRSNLRRETGYFILGRVSPSHATSVSVISLRTREYRVCRGGITLVTDSRKMRAGSVSSDQRVHQCDQDCEYDMSGQTHECAGNRNVRERWSAGEAEGRKPDGHHEDGE